MKCSLAACVVLALTFLTLGVRASDAPGKTLSLDLGGGVKLEMVLIPAGKFMMGSDKGGEKPAHEVTITKPFYMGKFTVTQAQYQQVIGSNPSKFKGAENPVDSISWEVAQKFCAKASEITKMTITLPTEAQWEYACRAGSKTAYYNGDTEADLEKAGWYSVNAKDTTHPCGKKEPNAWGLYDMHGNIWQWCMDWHDSTYYAKSPKEDPQGPESGATRVMRGGTYDTTAYGCRSAYRYSFEPARKFENMGFRVIAVTK